MNSGGHSPHRAGRRGQRRSSVGWREMQESRFCHSKVLAGELRRDSAPDSYRSDPAYEQQREAQDKLNATSPNQAIEIPERPFAGRLLGCRPPFSDGLTVFTFNWRKAAA